MIPPFKVSTFFLAALGALKMGDFGIAKVLSCTLACARGPCGPAGAPMTWAMGEFHHILLGQILLYGDPTVFFCRELMVDHYCGDQSNTILGIIIIPCQSRYQASRVRDHQQACHNDSMPREFEGTDWWQDGTEHPMENPSDSRCSKQTLVSTAHFPRNKPSEGHKPQKCSNDQHVGVNPQIPIVQMSVNVIFPATKNHSRIEHHKNLISQMLHGIHTCM